MHPVLPSAPSDGRDLGEVRHSLPEFRRVEPPRLRKLEQILQRLLLTRGLDRERRANLSSDSMIERVVRSERKEIHRGRERTEGGDDCLGSDPHREQRVAPSRAGAVPARAADGLVSNASWSELSASPCGPKWQVC